MTEDEDEMVCSYQALFYLLRWLWIALLVVSLNLTGFYVILYTEKEANPNYQRTYKAERVQEMKKTMGLMSTLGT